MSDASNRSESEVCDLVIRNTFYDLVDRTEHKERNSRRRTRSLDIDRGSCSSKSESGSVPPAGVSLETPSARDADHVQVADAGSTEPCSDQSSSAAQTTNSPFEATASKRAIKRLQGEQGHPPRSDNPEILCLYRDQGSFKRAIRSPETELIKYKALMDGATTVNVQNIRKDVTQAYFEYYVARVLGFDGQFDFLYTPTCFESGTSKGYGFVNLLTSDLAADFMLACAQHYIRATRADLQGREAYVSEFSKRKSQRVRNIMHKPIMLNPNGVKYQ
eukprot:TRINITY_DN1158_c0_g1_i1.p1 TRINITY_DN1158_c0_g1~~TRINITY_DN1158_c0_g1_i1.p1  ORF type:complete len:298 (+),score=32.36 TRINITY_DN1158_c0_g1_i1:71-895(+)